MYPILVKLTAMSILVVGGGKIATRKVAGLVAAGGQPVVMAPSITPQLAKMMERGEITWQQKVFASGDTAGFQMIFACTDQPEVNQEIAAEIQPGQLFNDTTLKERGNFYNLALVSENGVGLAVTTFGKDPHRSKQLKTILSEFLHKLTETKE